MLPFDSIGDPRKFEELTYELIEAVGFRNCRWRGLGADGGRDIEADWFYVDPSGHLVREQWYIECKYYSGSVPFAEIEPKLLAASRDNKDCLLVVTNSTLMNTCLDAVDKWVEARQGRPRFRYWNGHDLSKKLVAQGSLVQKYFGSVALSGEEVLRQALRARDSINLGVERRMASHLIGLAQSVGGRLEYPSATGNIERAREGLTLLVSHLQALRTLLGSAEVPSTRVVELRDLLAFLERNAQRRVRLNVSVPANDVFAITSRPLLTAALFELATNASLYGASRASLTLTVDVPKSIWRLAIVNDYSETRPEGPWPVLGWRGDAAKKLYPSGAGQGCWIAKSICETLGHQLRWEQVGADWVTVTEGVLTND